MTDLLAKSLARVLHSGNQRVEAMFPGKVPDAFIGALVSELDRKNGTGGADLPYSIWVRKQPSDGSPIEDRHVKLSGEVVSYRNNHPRILVYREGDYEPIAGVVGSARSIMPPAFPLDESGHVTLENTAGRALEILAEETPLWGEIQGDLAAEIAAVTAKWAEVFESMTGQELGWNDAWWRYAVATFDRVAALDPQVVKGKGATWAACVAGRYPLPAGGKKVSESRWSNLSKAVDSVFCNSETAREAVKRYEARGQESHPAEALDLEGIDRLLPLGPDQNSGNRGLALSSFIDPGGKCWGSVTESQMDSLVGITTGGSNQAAIRADLGDGPVDLPINGASGKKPVYLLPIAEWECVPIDGTIEVNVEGLRLFLPWSDHMDPEAPLPEIRPDAEPLEIGCRPSAGLSITGGQQTAGVSGLEVELSLRIVFKLGKTWKTGPYHLQFEVPANHPAWAGLEPLYEARLVIPTPWGVTVVCSHGNTRNSVNASGDSVFNLDEDGKFIVEEPGSVTIRHTAAPVKADLLVYDTSQQLGDWGPDASCDPLMVDGARPSDHWKGCWEAPGLELQQGSCVEDPESGDVILDVDVQEPDNRPLLPLIATLQDVSPSSMPVPDSFYGEHLLFARMDELLSRHLLDSDHPCPHGLAQVVAMPGPPKLAKEPTIVGNILWPFVQDAAGGLKARYVGSGPSAGFMELPETKAFQKALAKVCGALQGFPSSSLMLSRKQFRDLEEGLVEDYLQRYLDMVDAARGTGSPADFFWSTHPCSVVFMTSGSGAQLEVAAALLSPLHPVRLGWLYGCERVFANLKESNAALAQVVEGWNFPALTPGPSQEGLQPSAMMAIPMDPGPGQLFFGWSLVVKCQSSNPSVLEVPGCEYAGMRIPGGATSGISPSGVATALRDYLRSYPHLGSLILEITSRLNGQRSSSLDHAIIDRVHELAGGKLGLSSVKVIDDSNRRGSPPSQEDTVTRISGRGRGPGAGIERFEWIRTHNGGGDGTLTDIRFVEDAAADFAMLSGGLAEKGVGSTLNWPIRRFAKRLNQGENSHLIQYDIDPPASAGLLQRLICEAVASTERTMDGGPRAIAVYADLQSLVGGDSSSIQWTVIGNVGLDVATLSKLSAEGDCLLWEWRPPFVDSSETKSSLMPDLSRRSFTCIASISKVFAGHIADLKGVDQSLAEKVLRELGARGVGLASLLSVDDKHAEGALGFYLAYDLVAKALARIRSEEQGEVDLILPMDAIDPFLRTMAAGESFEEESRKKADLLLARITPPCPTSGNWKLMLIPVEITCRGFTNDPKPDFVGPASQGVCSKQMQLSNSHITVSGAIERLNAAVDESRAAWVSALGCILEMGVMLGLPDMESSNLKLPEMVAALCEDKVELQIHPGMLLWFSHLQKPPNHRYLKLPQPNAPHERPHRALFVAPELPGDDDPWDQATIDATAAAIRLEDDDVEPPPQPAPNPPAQPHEGNGQFGDLEKSAGPEVGGSGGLPDTNEGEAGETEEEPATPPPPPPPATPGGWWEPVMNDFGMVGQIEVIRSLHSLVALAKAMGNRMSDQMFVGPAGVGKSTIARKLAEGLGLRLVEMNGASLRNGGDLIERIGAEELLPDPEGTKVVINPCILFIDEVHAIGAQVHDLLLSALDDRRASSHGVYEYSFEDTIILLATTDPGKLSDAFLSRPNQVVLSPYSLKELAAIVFLQGCQSLGGYELSEEICTEIAARNQANPRRSVRCLKERLVAHFFQKLCDEGLQTQGLGREEIPLRIGQAMTLDDVCGYFEGQGIDRNGIGRTEMRMLKTLKERGPIAAKPLMQACGITNDRDFISVWEYSQRLGLVEIVAAGRALTQLGGGYVLNPGAIDLRDRIV